MADMREQQTQHHETVSDVLSDMDLIIEQEYSERQALSVQEHMADFRARIARALAAQPAPIALREKLRSCEEALAAAEKRIADLEAAQPAPADLTGAEADRITAEVELAVGACATWDEVSPRDLIRAVHSAMQPAPSGVVELKERPDFIAGYDAGLRDGKLLADDARAAAAVPDGWMLVPREPTQDMLRVLRLRDSIDNRKTYAAMLSAAPQPKPAEGGAVDWITPEMPAAHIIDQVRMALTFERIEDHEAASALAIALTRIAAPAEGGAAVGKIVAWSRPEFITDDAGAPIGTDEPRVVWGSEHPDPSEVWSPLYNGPIPAGSGEAVYGINSPNFNPVAWFDAFNAHLYTSRAEAQKAHDAGNPILPVESVSGSGEAVAKVVTRYREGRDCLGEAYGEPDGFEIRLIGKMPPVGTKLYAGPAADAELREDNVVAHIASLAHEGGLATLSEWETLCHIRRLTLRAWKAASKKGSGVDRVLSAIDEARRLAGDGGA